MINELLREKLKEFKKEKKKNYKVIAEETGIPYRSLINFSSGHRNLSPTNEAILNRYLEEMK